MSNYLSKYFSKEKWKNLWYTMAHPIDGFYWIRRKDRGSLPIAILLVVLFSIGFSLNRYKASFVVNDINPLSVNALTELIGVLFLYFLLCVSNWSVTCLMNGEGRLKDIAIVIGYAMVPLILTYYPATFISQYVAKGEEAFYYLVLTAGVVYSLILILIGIMQIHGYSLGRTLITLLLTIVAMLIIIFLLLLLVDLVGQVYNFFYSIYMELLFRN